MQHRQQADPEALDKAPAQRQPQQQHRDRQFDRNLRPQQPHRPPRVEQGQRARARAEECNHALRDGREHGRHEAPQPSHFGPAVNRRPMMNSGVKPRPGISAWAAGRGTVQADDWPSATAAA